MPRDCVLFCSYAVGKFRRRGGKHPLLYARVGYGDNTHMNVKQTLLENCSVTIIPYTVCHETLFSTVIITQQTRIYVLVRLRETNHADRITMIKCTSV